MTNHVDPRIEAAAKAMRSTREFMAGASFGLPADAYGQYSTALATAALAAADKAAVLHASHHVRRDWANYIETWESTIGGPVCNPQNIVAALRAKGTPFGVSASDRGTE